MGICMVYTNNRSQSNVNEHFIANSNLTSLASMDFSYLTNPNYAKKILATYYLNDDKKINGNRVVIHPYMYTRNNNYGYYWYNPNLSNSIYKNNGVRI